MVERLETRFHVFQPQAQKGLSLSIDMPLYKQPKNEGSCSLYSLWMATEALGFNIFSREKLKRMYNELVNAHSSGNPIIYTKDLLSFSKKSLPEVNIKFERAPQEESLLEKLITDSIESGKVLIPVETFENLPGYGHTVVISSFNHITREIKVNDSLRGVKPLGRNWHEYFVIQRT